MENVQKTTIQLIRYILTGDVPVIDTDTDFELLYGFSRSHGVECMVYDALKKLDIPIPSGTAGKFENAYIANVMIDTMQTEALTEISQAFENAGIDHIPLKGSTVKFLYPMPHYRKCGDIDILIKPEDEEKAEKVMTELGYSENETSKYHETHRVFIKNELFRIEIHRKLIPISNRASDFGLEVWKRTKYVAGFAHRYEMQNEYLYAYIIAHFCKHLKNGGLGISHLNDIFVIRRLEVNSESVKEFVKKSKLTEINEWINAVADMWYGQGNLNAEMRILENIILCSGNYGTAEQRNSFTNSLNGFAKAFVFLRKAIPANDILKYRCREFDVDKKTYITRLLWHWKHLFTFRKEKLEKYYAEYMDRSKNSEDLKKILKFIE